MFNEGELEEDPNLSTKPHSIIFVFDGSLDKVPNGQEEVEFYSKVLKKCREKGYFYPQIVLTRIDKLEEQVKKMIKRGQIGKDQRDLK